METSELKKIPEALHRMSDLQDVPEVTVHNILGVSYQVLEWTRYAINMLNKIRKLVHFFESTFFSYLNVSTSFAQWVLTISFYYWKLLQKSILESSRLLKNIRKNYLKNTHIWKQVVVMLM